MKFYYVYTTTYHNDTKIGTKTTKMLTNEEPEEKIVDLNWNNLSDWYHKNGLLCKFNLWNFKKGRQIDFFVDKWFYFNKDEKPVKEWKNKDLNIKIKTTYKEFTPCIKDVLEWYELDKAIIYLNERNLKINTCVQN